MWVLFLWCFKNIDVEFFIEMYFIYEIHPFKVYNVVILEYMLKVNWFWIF